MNIKLTQEEAELCYKVLRGAYVDMEIWYQDADEDESTDWQRELEMLDSVLDRLAEIANIAR